MVTSSFQKVLRLFCLLSATLTTSCGSTQTSENTEQIAKNVEVSTDVASGASTTLAISSGSATGTEITLEDGALEDGSTLSLDRVEQPSEFADFTSSNGDGESTFTKASSAIEVKGNSGGASPNLASPMTIAIPYRGATSLRFYLTGVAKTASNICVIHKSQAGELFFFRGKLLQVESSEEKIKFKSSTFGVYQLFFCGANTPSGFQDAGENGISAPPPGADPTTFSSYGGEASFKLSIDSSAYSYDSSKYCLILGTHGTDDGNISVISANEFNMSGSNMDLTLDLDTSELGDEAAIIIVLLMQSSSQSCSFEKGSDLNQTLSYDRSYRFKTNKKDLSNQTANGSFGSGAYSLSEKVIRIGTPSSVSSSEAIFSVNNVCVSGIAKNDEGKVLARMFLNTEISGEANQSIAVGIPDGIDGFKDVAFEVNMNSICEQESFNYTDSYPVKIDKAHSDGSYYLAPISLSIPETVQAQLAIVSNKNVCAELYHGNFTSNNVATSDSSKNLGLWNLADEGLTIYVPFGSEKMQGDVPIFDILFHLSSDCKSNFPGEISVASNDENLFD